MAWTIQGNVKGAKGDQGDPGSPGSPGSPGAQGPQGDPGAQGPAGVGISIQNAVANYAALPDDLTLSDAGKAYLVQTDDLLYVWSGSAFPADGSGTEWVGPQGEQGIQGIQGEQGDPGTPGAPGDPGPRGSKWFTGSGSPTGVTGSVTGDFYLDTGTGDVYELT